MVAIFLVTYIVAIPEFRRDCEDQVSVSVSGIECPKTDRSEMIITHTGYHLSYNQKTNCPNWVAWELTSDEVNSKTVQRSDDFKADPQVPLQNQIDGNAYKHSGYDRGHMCPAADMRWSADAMSDCFYMSNICPQTGVLNQKWWEHLESASRRWATQEGIVYICCGPLFNDTSETIGKEKKIMVPSGFFKVILSLKSGEEKAIGFLYRNDESRQTMESAAYSVDVIEELTGYDFFYQLNDELEEAIEARCDLRSWD